MIADVKKFTVGFGFDFFGNIAITERLILGDESSEALMDPVKWQLIPAYFGMHALKQGIQDRNSTLLGYAAGTLSIQLLRYVTNCYDTQSENCSSPSILKMGGF